MTPNSPVLLGQLDLERHDGRTFEGVAVRVTQRVLAMAVGIWHNNLSGAAVSRSLVAMTTEHIGTTRLGLGEGCQAFEGGP